MTSKRRIRSFSLALLAPVAGLALAACTAILPPGPDQVGVDQCGNSEDCAGLGYGEDTRQKGECVTDDAVNAPGVCMEAWEEPSCDPVGYPQDSEFFMAFDQVDPSAYAGCAEANNGKAGCPPMDNGQCEDGLTPQAYEGVTGEVCLRDDGMILPPTVDRAGDDVRHEFCRWFFDDDSFVCNFSTSKCVPCEESDPDAGGCVVAYVNGAPSPVYGTAANDGSKTADDFVFSGMHAEALPSP
jgi:hypothetical protein